MWKIPSISKPIEPYAWMQNVFTPEELDLIIDIGKSLPLVNGGVNDANTPASTAVRRSKIAWIYPEVSNTFIFVKLTDALLRINDTFFNYDLTELEDLQFTEYDSSYEGMYRNHTDDGYDTEKYRKLSFTLQLSDPTDYEGGDLQLYRWKLDQPNVVKKERGLLSVFTSSTIHEVTPVTKGTRYTLVGWANGPRFR
jgi:PKHD-type hydroxylase